MTVASAQIGVLLGGRTLELGSGRHVVQIGRDASCDLSINSIAVSRFHGRLSRTQQGHWVYQDQGSTNGSYVQGSRVDAIQVTPGLVINLGGVHGDHLSFHVLGPATMVPADSPMSVQSPRVLAHTAQAYPGHGFSQQGYAQPQQAPVMMEHAVPAQSDRSLGNGAIAAGLVAGVLLLLGAIGIVAADKSTTLDVRLVEQDIESGIEAQTGVGVSVECPTEMIGEPGDEFRCFVTSAYGPDFAVVRVENSKGDITWDVR